MVAGVAESKYPDFSSPSLSFALFRLPALAPPLLPKSSHGDVAGASMGLSSGVVVRASLSLPFLLLVELPWLLLPIWPKLLLRKFRKLETLNMPRARLGREARLALEVASVSVVFAADTALAWFGGWRAD